MAIHSSILAQKIPWTEEPGGLWSMELQITRHDRAAEHTHTQIKDLDLEKNECTKNKNTTKDQGAINTWQKKNDKTSSQRTVEYQADFGK